jgi:hypothetical protein
MAKLVSKSMCELNMLQLRSVEAKKPEPAKVEQVEEDSLPEVDEDIVASMSEQVSADESSSWYEWN